MKNFLFGTLMVTMLVGIQEATAEVPDSPWNPAMDNNFTVTDIGLGKGINTNFEWNETNIAWNQSFLTGVIDGEVVYRTQSKEGLRNEKGDTEDSTESRHSRAEWGTVSQSYDDVIKLGDTTTIEYSFYIPEEVDFSGHSVQLFGQTHGWHSDNHAWAVMTLPSRVTGQIKNVIPSSYSEVGRNLKSQDLVFSVRGLLDAQGHGSGKFGTEVRLARAGTYQGKWNTISVTQTWGKGDTGAMKVVFNGKTIVDCTCDNSQTHPDYRSTFQEYGSRDPGFVFQFGIHRFLVDPYRFTNVVDPVVYYKNVSVIKH